MIFRVPSADRDLRVLREEAAWMAAARVIHRFNEMGMASLDPQWAGGRPRLIGPDDEAFIVTTASTRPEKLDSPSPAGEVSPKIIFTVRDST